MIYNPFVSIIILNYNGINDTIECLDSLKQISYDNYEVIVVDNASSDNSSEALRKRDDIKFIEADKNYGFAEGNNIGACHAKGELICLLNNDTVVDKDFLKEMISTMQDAGVGETYSSFFNYSRRFEKDKNLAEIENLRSGSHTLLGYTKCYNFFDDYVTSGLDASACCCMYRKDIINEPFDKDYFMYYEDVYLAWKIRLMGYDIKRSPRSLIYHKVSKTMKKRGRLMIYLEERNRLMNLLCFYSKVTLLKLTPLFILDAIVKIPIIFIKMFIEREYAMSLLKAHTWVILNLGYILKKRKKIQSIRKVDDSKIISLLSYKWRGDKTPFDNILNYIFYRYVRMAGLKTYDIIR